MTEGLNNFDLIDMFSSPTAIGVTALLIVLGYVAIMIIKAISNKRASAAYNAKYANPDIRCPHCSQDIEKVLQDNMAKHYHKEVVSVDCPKCGTRMQWDVIGWPPVLRAKSVPNSAKSPRTA